MPSPTSQPSKKSSLIGDVRRPIFESGLPTVSPGVPFSITKPVTPGEARRPVGGGEDDEDVALGRVRDERLGAVQYVAAVRGLGDRAHAERVGA